MASKRNAHRRGRQPTSMQFWWSVLVTVVLAAVAYGTLVSGNYKNSQSAPPVEPATALALVAVCATTALVCSYVFDQRRSSEGGRGRNRRATRPRDRTSG